MSDSSANLLDANPVRTNPFDWLFSPIVRVLFLASVAGGIFFVAEHNVLMSQIENFVEDIEDQESWAAGGNSLRRVTFLGCAAIGVMSLLLGRGKSFRLTLPVAMTALYLLWAGASVLWSIDPGTTVRRYTLVLCCAIGCFGICKLIKVKEVVFAAVIVSFAFLILGVAAEVVLGAFLPHKGEYRFAGTMHPNAQGANLAMGCIAAWTMAKIKPNIKLVFYGMFGLLFLFLVLTKCRSATATVPVALAVIWVASQPTRNILLGFAAGFWMLSFIALACLVSGFDPIAEYSEILLLGRGEETGSSLTGRLPLWQDLSLYITFRPWQGYGFGAFWTPRHINDIAGSQQWVISEAHSSYYDTTLQLGIVGCILMVSTALTTFFYSAITFRRTLKPEYLFLIGGTFFCIARAFTESRVNDPGSCSTFLFLAIAAHSWVPIGKTIGANEEAANDTEPVPDRVIPSVTDD